MSECLSVCLGMKSRNPGGVRGGVVAPPRVAGGVRGVRSPPRRIEKTIYCFLKCMFDYCLASRGRIWMRIGEDRSRFSMISVIMLISGGYQDLLPGFYQVFTFNSLGISRFQSGKPTRNLLEKTKKTLYIPIKSYSILLNGS